MVLARDTQPAPAYVFTSIAAPESPTALIPGVMLTIDGRPITGGTIELREAGGRWSGVLRRPDRAGAAATLYFGQGLREVVVRLQDGRHAGARITGSSFAGYGERIYHFE
jgi:hypothetical protein